MTKKQAKKSSATKVAKPAAAPKGSLQSALDAWRSGLNGSPAYIANLARRAQHFVDWASERSIASVSKVDTAALVAYRRAYSVDRAIATVRMDLSRVVSFLRTVSSGADISVLRVKQTDAERAEQAAPAPAPKPAAKPSKADEKLRAVFKREQAAAAAKTAKAKTAKPVSKKAR